MVSPLWNYPICFADHTLYFYRPTLLGSAIKDNNGHFFGTAFVYLGPNEARFIEIFSQFGTIAKQVSTPRKAHPVNLDLWSALSSVTQEQSEDESIA